MSDKFRYLTEDRPVEPFVSNEDAEDWADIADWEESRAEFYKSELSKVKDELERLKSEDPIREAIANNWKVERSGEGIALNSLTGRGGVYVTDGDSNSIGAAMLWYLLDDYINAMESLQKRGNE